MKSNYVFALLQTIIARSVSFRSLESMKYELLCKHSRKLPMLTPRPFTSCSTAGRGLGVNLSSGLFHIGVLLLILSRQKIRSGGPQTATATRLSGFQAITSLH
jgi:hypothetical protein